MTFLLQMDTHNFHKCERQCEYSFEFERHRNEIKQEKLKLDFFFSTSQQVSKYPCGNRMLRGH